MKHENLVAAVVVALIVAMFVFMSNAQADTIKVEDRSMGVGTSPITVMQYVAAENVLKETRTFRQAVGAAGAAYGLYAGYSAGVAAGMTPVGITVLSVSTGITFGASMYGASTMGAEIAIHKVSEDAKNAIRNLGADAEKTVKNFLNRL